MSLYGRVSRRNSSLCSQRQSSAGPGRATGRSSVGSCSAGPDARPSPQVKRNTTLSRALAAERRHSKARPGHLGDSSLDASHLAATPQAAPPEAPPQGLAAPGGSPAPPGALGSPPHAAPQPQGGPPPGGPRTVAQPAPGRASRQAAPQREEQAVAGRVTWVDTRQQPQEQRRGAGAGAGGAGAAQGDAPVRASPGERRHPVEASLAGSAGSASAPLRKAPGAGAVLGAGNRGLTAAKQRGPEDPGPSSASTSSPSRARPPSTHAEPTPGRSWRTSLTSSLRQSSASEAAGASGEAWARSARGSELGGVGERLDPRKWGVVDCRLPREEDPERSSFDLRLLEMLNGRAAAAPAEARGAAPSTPRPMSAAFTDRSLRRREGLGSRALVLEYPAEAPPAGAHQNCCCPVCKPFDLSPAGHASYAVPANLMQSAHRGAEAAAPGGAPRGPPGEPARGGGGGSPNYESSRMGRILQHAPEPRPDGRPWELDEGAFQRQLGRKAKAALCRSLSADARDPAGGYRKATALDLDGPAEQRHRIRGRAGAQGAQGREEAAMALAPRASDPPLPSKITAWKKGDGEHKYAFSRHSERVSLHWNQPLYRYEAPATDRGGPRRSASVPPRAGRPEALGWGRLAGEGGEEAPTPGRGVHRALRPREGAGAAELTDHEALASRAACERAERLESDGHFADLCALTEQTRAREGADISAIKERNYHKSSANMASALSWSA